MIAHNPKELALFIKQYRKKQQLSQSEVAEMIGLKQATLSAFENNPEHTKIDTLFRILSAIRLEIQVMPRNQASSEWSEEW